MVEYMARDGYYMAFACGSDLTAWDNAQAALIVGELNEMDWFVGASVQHTKPKTVEVNPMTASHYPKRLDEGRDIGIIATTHYLQTGILTANTMGAVSTVEASPNVHTITKDTDVTPLKLAFHVEKEGTIANRRKDMMGLLPMGLDIGVSEPNPTAKQTYNGEFAFTGAGGDLAQPTALTQVTHTPYNWYHYRDSNGASEFKYNSGAINVSIIGFLMHIGWKDKLFGPYDLNGYPTNGVTVPPFASYVDMDVRITDEGGTDINVIADTKHASYAGDLDFIADFYESATRFLKYTWDKTYIVPNSYREVFQERGAWFDGAQFRLALLNETSSLAVEEKNALNNDYYLNP